MAFQGAPVLFRGLCQLESHRQHAGARHAAPRLGGAQSHRREGRFEGVGGAQVQPVLSRKIIKRQQAVAILGQTLGRFRILRSLS